MYQRDKNEDLVLVEMRMGRFSRRKNTLVVTKNLREV